MFRRLDADRQQDFKRRVRFCAHERRKGPGVETCISKCILHAIARAFRPRLTKVTARPWRKRLLPLLSFGIRLQVLASLFAFLFMRLFEPRDYCAVEIAPLRKLKAKLCDFIRQVWRRSQYGLVHGLVMAFGIIVALGVERLDFAADGHGKFGRLFSPWRRPSFAQLDGD
jgi:hypothetical protein